MNITSIRDAADIEASIPWFDDYPLRSLIVYATINAASAFFLTWLTLKVLFRYNNCRW